LEVKPSIDIPKNVNCDGIQVGEDCIVGCTTLMCSSNGTTEAWSLLERVLLFVGFMIGWALSRLRESNLCNAKFVVRRDGYACCRLALSALSRVSLSAT
jgi:hypothetical protein